MESKPGISNAPIVCNIESIMTISPVKSALLMDNIHTAVLVFDKSLRLTEINTAAENLLSVSQRMVQGRLDGGSG